MKEVVFSLGRTTIRGIFTGTKRETIAGLEIEGEIEFELDDWFRDPLDLTGKLPEGLLTVDDTIIDSLGSFDAALRNQLLSRLLDGLRFPKSTIYDKENKDFREFGYPYPIVDRWSARVVALIFHDRSASRFSG